MKTKLYSLVLLLFAGYTVSAQVLRSMTARYSNPSVRGNIVYVSNNFVTSSGGITTELPPGGTETNNGKAGVNIDIDGTPPTTFFTFGTSWKYLANNTRPANWETSGFADGGWPSANSMFGYGDGDVVTCVPSGGGGTLCTPTGTKYTTTYFRKSITVANPSNYSDFTLNVYRDDGIVVYINGTEVMADNMPAGRTHGTYASSCAADDGDAINTFTIPTSAFSVGTNVIAVEVHQCNATSSDLVFDMELIGNPTPTEVTLIPYGGSWKYLANNTRPANWETVGFVDGAWPAGNAQFGYGDGDEVTCVPSGGGGTLCNPSGTKWITTYFRKAVTIPNTSLYTSFKINLIRDDGVVVYVNGVEAFRENMPAGAVVHGTLATTAIGGIDETTPVTYIIPTSAFINGANTIAVELHQSNATSSDLSFDFELVGSTDSTFNSSSSDLSLPSCSQVLFAGLYWGASQGTNGTDVSWITNENTVKLKIPGSAVYQNVTASQVDYHNNTLVPGLPHTGYHSFANITSLINVANANGTYVLANMASPAGIDNACGGWTIVIVYADPATVVRNLTVFDGNVVMNGGDPAVHIPITGFLTPPSGPVSCELGAVVYDGDRVSTDEYSFKQNSNPLVGTYTSLTPNATANLNDMWNSTISYKGATVTTRNPAHNNTLGYDADIIDLPNPGNVLLGNSQSSASIRFSSPSENYVLQVSTTAISQYTPSFSVSKDATDLNGGALNPGDSIRYRVDYANGGNDASTATTIVDNIPAGTTYAPNSLIINGVAKTDAIGDDEAEYDFANDRVVFRIGTGANGTTGGEVSPAASGYVTFKVFTPSTCAVLACNSTISNRARINYGGKLSGISLSDTSGVLVAGCNNPNPVVNIISGTCSNSSDTILLNTCPSITVNIPVARYGGYRFYSGIPFTSGNRYNPATPVTFTRIIYAFYDGPGSCDDTIRINIYIAGCPDIDDDRDGIPDYVEMNNPLALLDHNSNGIPNWADPAYPGFVDNNIDGFNDNFDPGADSDNDGIPNFYDADFPGYIDSNGDGVNDNMDKDLDGIPNYLDRDSDNDGIPDTIESFGVDADGDGRIDNFTDTDNDGLSDNVDGNTSGGNFLRLSGLGLGALDTDSDGIPNYLDLDSDNDGIPDIIETFGNDAGNSAKISGFADSDGDGFADGVDGDVGNDLIAENSTNALLRSGADINNDGRADSWPYKNFDSDSKPNPYDLDSDGDGLSDVIEAQLTDVNWDGRVDGAINYDGRNTVLAAMGSFTLPNTDGIGRANPYDIDSDDDGIPDNIEGLTTNGYLFPSYTDTDGDGIDDAYDSFVGFGGDGIHPVDTDGDSVPDYLDLDTDNDGLIDRIEGNDLNLNGMPDDLVTLTGLDTDGDGLDDRFDNDNGSIKGTSSRMGNGGSLTGDPSPGSTTVVQRTPVAAGVGCGTERDWRCIFYVLHCEIINFKATLYNQNVKLDWSVLCRQEADHFTIERSFDGANFVEVQMVNGRSVINEVESYTVSDNITSISNSIIYYRLKTVLKNGKVSYSSIILVKKDNEVKQLIQVFPNPVKDKMQLNIWANKSGMAKVYVIDASGRTVKIFNENYQQGNTTFSWRLVTQLPSGSYYLKVDMGEQIITTKFNILK